MEVPKQNSATTLKQMTELILTITVTLSAALILFSLVLVKDNQIERLIGLVKSSHDNLETALKTEDSLFKLVKSHQAKIEILESSS